MKIYANLLALSALYSTSWAFVAPGRLGAPATTTSLHSVSTNQQGWQTGSSVNGNSARPSGVAPSVSSGSMSRSSTQADRSPDMKDQRVEVVQGGSLRTWSFPSIQVERVQVVLSTEGRPLNANIELWQGPDNTPQKMQVYIEDGAARPFNAIIETPRGSNAVAIRNTNSLEFPLSAVCKSDKGGRVIDSVKNKPRTVQGGAVHTYAFAPQVSSVQVLLKTDGRPMSARIELLQGPNNNKQTIDLYSEDGLDRPFYAIIETPGTGNVVRVVNTATMEYPLSCSVEPYREDNSFDPDTPIISGGGATW